MSQSTQPVLAVPHSTIRPEQVKVQGPERPTIVQDAAAISLVYTDAQRAQLWLDQKHWALGWRDADILYQSPRQSSVFEGSQVTRANVSRFTVAKHVNTLVPAMMSGIFYEMPPFQLRPRGRTTEQTCEAKKALFAALLEEIDFKTEAERGLESDCLNGTGIWKRGWEVRTEVVKEYRRKSAPVKMQLPGSDDQGQPAEQEIEVNTEESDDFEVVEREVTRSRPFFEHKPLGTVFVDPGWRHANQIWKAKYVIERAYPTFEDLNALREQDGYAIPSEDELKAYFFPQAIAAPPSNLELSQSAGNSLVHHAERRDLATTIDPLAQPLELLERWDARRVMVILQLPGTGQRLLIRNEEHKLGKIPYYSCNWWNIQGAGYGLGVGRLVGSDQRVEQGSMNAALDILAFAVNPQYVRSTGANAPTQQIRQRLGGIIDVTGDVEKAFRLMEQPKVPPETWTVIQAAKQASDSASGADEAFTQGSLPRAGMSSAARTATGAGNIAAANAARIQGPVGRFVDNVFLPFLYDLDEMIRERMPLSEIREIVSDERGEEFALDMADYMNARLKFEVLAGAHLAAKKAMAQSLPLLIEIFNNPHLLEGLQATGWTVDVKELFDMMMEMSEWKNTRQVIRRMNQDEQQQYSALKNQMPAKTQSDIAKIQATHQARAQELDQESQNRTSEKLIETALDRAGGYVLRLAAERAMEPTALQGEPGGSYHEAMQPTQ